MSPQQLEMGLKQLGLDEKSAKVYLASLELGPAPVQKIALRSHVPRATTYLVLGELQEKGLVSTFEKGKKTFFVAESPHQLSALVNERAAMVHQQQQLLKDLLPLLDAHGQFKESQRPVVRYYEGPKAVKAFIRDALSGSGGNVITITHLDRAKEVLDKAGFPFEKVAARRRQLGIQSRVIYTATQGPVSGYATADRLTKYVPEKDFPFAADISSRGDMVFFIPYTLPLRGVAIQDATIASTMRLVFDLLWVHVSEKNVKSIDKTV